MKKKDRISTEGSQSLDNNPFAALSDNNLPSGQPKPTPEKAKPEIKKKGRVNIRREKSGRGGKIVTVIYDFERRPDGNSVKKMLKELQSKLGCGGALKQGAIELQGDKLDAVSAHLESKGYRPVKSGS